MNRLMIGPDIIYCIWICSCNQVSKSSSLNYTKPMIFCYNLLESFSQFLPYCKLR